MTTLTDVSDWESGRCAPRLASLIRWCDGLGMTLTVSSNDETDVSDGA